MPISKQWSDIATDALPRHDRPAMRIFYAAANSPNPLFRSNLWRANLRDSLAKLNHEIVEFQFDLERTFQHLDPADAAQAEFIRQNRPRLSDALLQQIQKAHSGRPIDLFFSYFYDACVEPDAIRQISSMGIVTANWFCNGAHQFRLVSEIAPVYNFSLVPEKFRLSDYRSIGANAIYCQEAANPDIYFPQAEPELYEAGFVGQAYGERPSLIEWLVSHGIEARVWGSGWEHFQKRRPSLWPARWKQISPAIPSRLIGGVLSDQDVVRTFHRTKVNLGFAACWTEEGATERITQIRLRDFEVPMSGAFYLTEYQDELRDFFEIDSEIVCYRNREELLDKVRFYLGHPDLRIKIRQAGRERCLREHTWEKRFQKAFQEMGL
jgi:spore maturation protein CgeB